MNPLIPIEYIILLAVPVLLCAGIVAWRTTRQSPTAWRLAMTLSRTLAVAGVLALLLNVGAKREHLLESNASWAIMLDQSASMAFADIDKKSRWDVAIDLVKTAFDISTDTNKIKLYTFADTSKKIEFDALAAIPPDGSNTRIIESGQNILAREKHNGALLKGVLLISDGRQPVYRSPDTFALRAAARGVPVFPIVMGGDVPVKDLEVKMPRLRHVSFAGQPVSLSGVLINRRMGPVKADVVLRDTDGNVLGKRALFAIDEQPVDFRFDIPQDTPGYFEYIIETPLQDGEADRSNNTAGIGVFVLSEKLSVLLLEGEPYWDTKFLSHLLHEQTSIAMTAVFRVKKDRFFMISTETAVNASDTDMFPLTDEEIAAYDLVVMGRGTEYFIDEERAHRLEGFVRDQGGCLFFARGKSYAGSDSFLQNLEPVKWGKSIKADFSLHPLLAGEQVGLFGGLLPARDDSIWQGLPPLARAHECPQLNSFASILAQGIPDTSAQKPFPLIVSKRYGRGLVLLINGDGLWQWGFSPKASDKNDLYQNLWLRLFQWAVSFSEFNPGSDYFILTDHSTAHIGETLQVSVRARAHVKSEDIVVRVYHANRLDRSMTLVKDSSQNSGWSGLLTLSSPGVYRLATETPDGKDLGAQATVQIIPAPGETDNLSADKAFLETLAVKSGGRLITQKDLSDVIMAFESPAVAVRRGDVSWEELWDNAWVAVLLMLLFSLEWYWRRRQGLR
jgi:hypothetical protein